jgi:mRNA-degrading endonuclease RelE of RelBE toxin-antitoxin system
MKVEYSQSFVKAANKLSGKALKSVKEMLENVKKAEKIEDIANCKKLINYDRTYRIRIGSLRAFFVLYIITDGSIVKFEYLKFRGEAYKKETMEELRKKDTYQKQQD